MVDNLQKCIKLTFRNDPKNMHENIYNNNNKKTSHQEKFKSSGVDTSCDWTIV